MASEGILSSGSYAVSQRAAGANMTIDIAASTGDGARIQGDAVTAQGIYRVAAHSAVANETISAAHATLPRNDLVVLEVKDNQHDASGSNLAQVRVVTGTATAGAAKTDALGVNGTPTLPSSAIPLAVVNVPATDTSISDSQIDDRRFRSSAQFGPGAPTFVAGAGGKAIIATEQTRTTASYATLSTPDQVTGAILPTDGVIAVSYFARWGWDAASTPGRAAIFLGSTQLQSLTTGSADAAVQETGSAAGAGAAGRWGALVSSPGGLISGTLVSSSVALPTTGLALGLLTDGGVCYIKAAAGTYDVSVRFKSDGANATRVKDRELRVWTLAFG